MKKVLLAILIILLIFVIFAVGVLVYGGLYASNYDKFDAPEQVEIQTNSYNTITAVGKGLYDENGNRRLYQLSFSDLQLQDDYDTLTEQLDNIRSLMVDVAIVDIHLANGQYSNYEASTLYTALLDEKLDIMIPKVNSMNLQANQEPIRETMESLLSYDLALYLQNISSALKSGDASALSAALSYREKWLRTYEILEGDIMEISEKLKLNDEKYYEWDLYKAVEKKDSSAVLNNTTEYTNG